MRPSALKIALLIDTSTSWGSGLIEGVAEFAHERVDWQIFLGARGKYERFVLPDLWAGDGVIARVTTRELAEQLTARRLPAVNVSWYRYDDLPIPQCTCDARAVAEMAADYFLSRGFRQFAYCGSALRPTYEDELGRGFVESLAERTLRCRTYQPEAHPDGFLHSADELERIIEWLSSLPKPVALLAFDALQARQITDVCHLAEIEVPQQIAVLGGEHDLLSCTISKPELSSIDHSPRRVGRAAAKMLAQLIRGELLAESRRLLPPARVITRQSTETVALADDMLSAALRYIHDNSQRRIKVQDIISAVPLSRRALEKGFRQFVGRSPAEEIRRVRVDHAVQLLCDTSWSMPRIATAAGFERAELLTRAFRRELGMTPSEFRGKHLSDRRAAN